MNDLQAGLVARVRRRHEVWKTDLQHRFRTDTGTRDRVFAWSTAALVVVGLVVVLTRAAVADDAVRRAVATGLGLLLVRVAMLRPAAPPHVHGLPGAPAPPVCPAPPPPDRTGLVLTVRWTGALLATSIAFGPWPSVLVLLAVLTVAAMPVALDKGTLWRSRRVIRRALAAYAPRFVLGYGGYGGGPIHVGMWEPHLLASGDRGVIVGLRGEYCAELREGIAPTMPWISAGSDVLGDMRVLTLPSITTFFYVHNAPGHLKLMGIRSVRHVWLGHGDSDKAGSHHPRHLRYDLLVASGEAAVDRYARHGVEVPRERFVLLGRPQSGEVMPAATSITGIERPTVLYTPTWTGNGKATDFSSIRVAETVLRTLLAADLDIVFRPHPVFLRDPYWSRRLLVLDEILRADHDDPSTPGRHVWGDEAVRGWSVAECMNHCDALVSDVSSVVSDWLASAKPYLMISVVHDLDRFAEEVPVAAGAYVVDRELSGLAEVLQQMLRSDPMADRRRRLRTLVLGDYEGDESARAFAQWVHEMAHTPMVRR